jgi:uncharacterized membrane protein YuzA (DUF378 family)
MLGIDMNVDLVNESRDGSVVLYIVVVLAGLSGLLVPILKFFGMIGVLVWFWRFGRAYGDLPILSQTMHSGQAAALCMVPILGWVVPYQLTKVYWDKTGGGQMPTSYRFWWPVFFAGDLLGRIDTFNGGEELTLLAPISYILTGLGAAMFFQTLRSLGRRRANAPGNDRSVHGQPMSIQ